MHCSIEHGGFEHELKAILGTGVGSTAPAESGDAGFAGAGAGN
jgi:hypothetical protein